MDKIRDGIWDADTVSSFAFIALTLAFFGSMKLVESNKSKTYYVDSAKIYRTSVLHSLDNNLVLFPDGSKIILKENVRLPKVSRLENGECVQEDGRYGYEEIQHFINSQGSKVPIPKDLALKLTRRDFFSKEFCGCEYRREQRELVSSKAGGRRGYYRN